MVGKKGEILRLKRVKLGQLHKIYISTLTFAIDGDVDSSAKFNIFFRCRIAKVDSDSRGKEAFMS